VDTLHPFNASHLEMDDEGTSHAYLISGNGETVIEKKVDVYAWGQRVERWSTTDQCATWSLTLELTPIKGHRYQNIQFASNNLQGVLSDLFLFYGRQDPNSPGTGYLWDGR